MRRRVVIGCCLVLISIFWINVLVRNAYAVFTEDDGGGGGDVIVDDLNPGVQNCDVASCGGDGGGGTYYPPPPPPAETPPDPVDPDFPPPPPPVPGDEGDTGGTTLEPFVPPDNPPGGDGGDDPGGPPNPSPVSMGPLVSYCLGDNNPVIKLAWHGGNDAYYFKIFRSDMESQIANVTANTRAFDDYSVGNCGPSGCTTETVSRFDHMVTNNTIYGYAIEAMPLPGASGPSWTPGYSMIQAADCTPPPPPPTPATFSDVTTYCAGDLPVIRLNWINGDNAYYYKLYQYDLANNNSQVKVANIAAAYKTFDDYTVSGCGINGCTQPGYASRFDHSVKNLQYYYYEVETMPLSGAFDPAWSGWYGPIQAPICPPPPPEEPCPAYCHTNVIYVQDGLNVAPSKVCAPNNAANYGQVCNSAPNACGETRQGTYDCVGNCPAVTPAACTAPAIGPISNSTCSTPGIIQWSGPARNEPGLGWGYSVDISDTSSFVNKYSKWIGSGGAANSGSTTLPTDIDWQGYGLTGGSSLGAFPGNRTWYVRVWNGSFSGGLQSFSTNICTPTVGLSMKIGFNTYTNGQTVQITDNVVPTLSWAPRNATSCSASGSWGGAQDPNGGSLPLNGLGASVSTYIYTLSCVRGSGAVVSETVRLNVTKPPFIKTTGGNVHSNENIVTPGQ